MSKALFEPSVDTNFLAAKLSKVDVGEIVTYEELSDAIDGRDVRPGQPGYSALVSARRRLERQHGIVFGSVRKVGLKRLSDIGIVDTSDQAIASIRRKARRSAKRLTCVKNYEGMPAEKQVKHNAYMSIFGALAAASRASTVRLIEEEVAIKQDQLSLTKTLEFFKRG